MLVEKKAKLRSERKRGKTKAKQFLVKKKKKQPRVGEGELRPSSSKTLLRDSRENWNNIMMLNWLHVV